MSAPPGDEAVPGTKRRRGRPSKNTVRRAADEAIARTVWQLLSWGYTLRGAGGVAEVVGRVAHDVLKVADHAGRALGDRSIEEIFDDWSAKATRATGWVRAGQRIDLPVGKPWQAVQVGHLRASGPRNMTMREVAEKLLRNNGRWPDKSGLPGKFVLGDPTLTAKAWTTYVDEAPKFPPPGENGAEK